MSLQGTLYTPNLRRWGTGDLDEGKLTLITGIKILLKSIGFTTLASVKYKDAENNKIIRYIIERFGKNRINKGSIEFFMSLYL